MSENKKPPKAKAKAKAAKVDPGEMSPAAATFELAGEELAVISIPISAGSAFPDLTRAEREVAQLALSGQSNAEIAASRGTSINTVENQVASVFRKLGVESRAELATLASQRSGSSGDES